MLGGGRSFDERLSNFGSSAIAKNRTYEGGLERDQPGNLKAAYQGIQSVFLEFQTGNQENTRV